VKIRMKVLASTEIQSMDCVVLGKLGQIYPCILNQFHPHCGNAEHEYPETYSAVDWMISNRVSSRCKAVKEWLAQQLKDFYDHGLNFELSVEGIFAEIEPSDRTLEMCQRIWSDIDAVVYGRDESLMYANMIDSYLNQNFLRVRAGGKLNSSSANSIYFRISSKDYDWRDVIEDFLWDVFGDVDNMPALVWIGHDAETNPPEIVLFEGSPEELFDKFDSKVLASTKFS